MRTDAAFQKHKPVLAGQIDIAATRTFAARYAKSHLNGHAVIDPPGKLFAASVPANLIPTFGKLTFSIRSENIRRPFVSGMPLSGNQTPYSPLYVERSMKIELTPEARTFVQNREGEITLTVLSVGG